MPARQYQIIERHCFCRELHVRREAALEAPWKKLAGEFL
jgi:hypothetical protein